MTCFLSVARYTRDFNVLVDLVLDFFQYQCFQCTKKSKWFFKIKLFFIAKLYVNFFAIFGEALQQISEGDLMWVFTLKYA